LYLRFHLPPVEQFSIAIFALKYHQQITQALYYPTIEFSDIEALKRALLVWDRIYRIVPQEYVPQDSSEVRDAASTGAVKDLFVDEQEKSQAAQSFIDFYVKRNDSSNMLAWPAGFSTQTFTHINPGKIDAKLVPLFQQLARRFTDDGFLEVPCELAGGYMFYLATSVANRRGLDITTDSSDYWAVGSYFAAGGNFTEQVYGEHADAYLANLAIDDLLPKSLDSVPIDSILRFREDTAQLRHAFQVELKELKDELGRCNNKTHARDIVSDFSNRFEPAKKEYRKSLGFFNKNDVCSLLSVGLPIAAPMIIGVDPFTPLRLGVGMLLGAVSALGAREMIDKQRTVASYLVDAERLTRTPNRLLHKKFEEFIND